MIFKNQDVNADINIESVDLGNIHANFYTEDRGIASVRIFINKSKKPFNLTQTQFVPKLDLFLQDGSIFMNEPLQVIMPDKGIIQYNLRNEVIKHSGKVSAKLFLVKENESIHVANFDFNIVDSGVSGKAQKEVHISLVEDTIEKLFNEPQTQDMIKKLANDFLEQNPTEFKGPKGDKGDKGDTGAKGDKGDTGAIGPQGPAGSITGTDNWQKFQLTDTQGALRYVDLKNSLDNLRNLAGGTYYCANVPLDGMSGTTSSAGYITMYRRNDNITKYIQFRPYNSTQLFIMRFYNTWGTWEKQFGTPEDTGWINFSLINGATKGSSNALNAYRIYSLGSLKFITIRINIAPITNNAGQPVQMAKIPDNIVDSDRELLSTYDGITGNIFVISLTKQGFITLMPYSMSVDAIKEVTIMI